MTTDPDAAQDFYTDVVGWTTAPFEDAPTPYTMWMSGETPIGGLMELPQEAREGGVPPHWMGYVAVPDVDATAARAEELGGRIIMGPQDIPNVGRFVILHDPQGGTISAFRSFQEMSARESEPGPGDFSWHELATTDHEAALAFYSDLFGWESQQALDMGEAGVYQMYGLGKQMLGGMYNKTADMPGSRGWLYYIWVANLDAAVTTVRGKGGTIIVEPMEVPGGSRIAVGLDPQGGAFGLHQRA
jgi:predicted enzyme related to lactoylglutathione lyase